MTTSARLTLIISSLALVVSLLAAAVSPWVTYHWFDPTTKPFKERAVFVSVRSDTTAPESAGSSKEQSIDVRVEIELQNIGHLPANNAKIVAVVTAGKVTEPTIGVADRVAERTKASGSIFEYSLSQPVAPDSKITITARGSLVGLYLFTEYGDKTVLYEPSPSGGTSSW